MQNEQSGREHERMPINVVAEVTGDSIEICRFKVTDLSKTGAYLSTAEKSNPGIKVGTRIHLRLTWPIDTGTAPLEVDADVIRAEEEGIGIQFVY